MRNPFKAFFPDHRGLVFGSMLVGTLVVMVLLNMIGSPLITPAAPYGIISFELAGDVSKAQDILNSWDSGARMNSAFSLGFDYVFMIFYAITIGLACIWSSEILAEHHWPLSKLGLPLAWGQVIAALFDAVENLALVKIVFGDIVSPWPEMARFCALIKFSLVFVGLIYTFLGLILKFVAKISRRSA